MKSLKKIFNLLTSNNQYEFVKIVILILVATILESLGVGIVPSFVSYLSSSSENSDHFFSLLFTHFGILSPSRTWLIIYLGSSYLGFIIFKNIFLLYKTYIESKFINSIRVQITESLAYSYLCKDYEFLIEKNSSELIRNLTEEISQVIGGLIKPLIILINESILIVAITIVLLLNEPIISSLLITLILTASFIFYRFYTNKIKKLGVSRQYHYGKYIMWLDQTFKGFKEIKAFGVELDFLGKIIQELKEFSNSLEYIFFISEIPRMYIESILFISIFLIIVLSPQFGSSQSPLAGIALYGAGALKVVPSFSRLSSSITRFKFSGHALNAVDYELKNINRTVATISAKHKIFGHSDVQCKTAINTTKLEISTSGNVIEFAEVYYRYPGQEINAIDGVSLKISQPTSVGFVGLSGSGKSTLIDLLTGLLKPTKGKISIGNIGIADKQNLKWWRQSFAYIPQSIYILDDTIRNNIKFGLHDGDDEDIWNALKGAKLDDFVRSLPNKLDTFVGENAVRLSGGQRQRLGIARALYRKPNVIIMDEATSALDNRTEKEIIKSMYEISQDANKTLIIVAHRLTTIENCDCIYFMRNGRIADTGSYQKLLSTNEHFRNIALVSS